jgi:hypothetical protein
MPRPSSIELGLLIAIPELHLPKQSRFGRRNRSATLEVALHFAHVVGAGNASSDMLA